VSADQARRDRLVAELQRAAKARQVLPGFLARLCDRELSQPGRSDREALKRAKRALHQVGGAYLAPSMRYDRWLADLADADPGPARLARVAAILGTHTSMGERLGRLGDYYAALFDGVSEPDTILDLACGLNPLGRHLMPVTPRRYLGCDIYLDLLAFVASASELLGHPVETFPHDLLDGPPERSADLVLLLKTLPCLDQLDRSVSRQLLANLDAPTVLVTFPVRSLGGQPKGMRSFYRNRFAEVVDGLDYAITELDLGIELGFRLRRLEPGNRPSAPPT